MIAAIYARKSTDQNVSEEEKSVTRQWRCKHQGRRTIGSAADCQVIAGPPADRDQFCN